MTPADTLIELLERVSALQGAPAIISAEELAQWPGEAGTALKAQKLITKTRPASSAVCPGCENECVMPVHTIPSPSLDPALFVVCDKRSDTNRVEISFDALEQWQINTDSVARFIADVLSLRFSGKRQNERKLVEIGIVTGSKRAQMLCLLDGTLLVLVAGSNQVPLAEAIHYSDGRFVLDHDLIQQLVDTSNTADSRYTPSSARREVRKLETKARHEKWRKAYLAEKKKRPNMSDDWYSKKIAKMKIAQGCSAGTVRKNMK